MRYLRMGVLVSLLCTLGCGDEVNALLELDGADGGDRVDDAAVEPIETSPEPDAADSGVPMVHIHIQSAQEPFVHDDAYAGQTPLDQRLGILSLELGKGPGDDDPLVVFDHGSEYVEAGLNAGDDTLVASVPASQLRFGTFTHARVKVSHVRYRVRATMHAQGQAWAGEFDNVQVLTDGTLIDGTERDSGWFRFAFRLGGQTWGVREGSSGPLPEGLGSGGIALVVEEGVAAYTFAAEVMVDPGAAFDTKIVFVLNMHESFRWLDLPETGYSAGVFDTTPAQFEPVKRFGANSFTVGAE